MFTDPTDLVTRIIYPAFLCLYLRLRENGLRLRSARLRRQLRQSQKAQKVSLTAGCHRRLYVLCFPVRHTSKSQGTL